MTIATDIEPGKLYLVKEAAQILGQDSTNLCHAKDNGLIRFNIIGKITGILGSEIERYDKRPREKGWYDYERMRSCLPELTENDFNNWIIEKCKECDHYYNIRKRFGKSTISQSLAVRFYTDMTINKAN